MTQGHPKFKILSQPQEAYIRSQIWECERIQESAFVSTQLHSWVLNHIFCTCLTQTHGKNFYLHFSGTR